MKIIYDCDNTMGVYGRDIDDGLALMYLLEHKDAKLLGVCTTYGNEKIEITDSKTRELLRELEIDIPILRGRGNYNVIDYMDFEYVNHTPQQKEYSEAAQFIVDMVNRFPGEVHILATGSMQNLYDALEIDETVKDKVASTVLMGGITENLIFNGKQMKELNFSVCSKGAYQVIRKMNRVSILSGNNCMKIPFSNIELESVLSRGDMKNRFLVEKISRWMDYFKRKYRYDSVILWDVTAAIYLLHPELFSDRYFEFKSDEEDLKTGFLRLGKESCHFKKGYINLPEPSDRYDINKNLIDTVFGK